MNVKFSLFLFKFRSQVDIQKLCRNTKIIAEALARVIYNLTEKVWAFQFLHVFYVVACGINGGKMSFFK